MNAPSTDYQAFRRPMNEADRRGIEKIYRNAQKQARPAGFFAVVFALIGIFSGAGSLDFSTSIGLMSIMIILVGVFALGTAFFTFRTRKDVRSAFKNGNATVVRGPVSKLAGKANTASMKVGPVMIGWNSRSPNPLQDGPYGEVTIIPILRSVVSINGLVLDRPIKIVVPPELEARAAEGTTSYSTQPSYPSGQDAAPFTDAKSFCPSCGKPANGLAFCSECGIKL